MEKFTHPSTFSGWHSSFASAIKVVGVPCSCVIGLRASIPSHSHSHLDAQCTATGTTAISFSLILFSYIHFAFALKQRFCH